MNTIFIRKKIIILSVLLSILMTGMCLDTRKAETFITMSAFHSDSSVLYNMSNEIRTQETCTKETMGRQYIESDDSFYMRTDPTGEENLRILSTFLFISVFLFYRDKIRYNTPEQDSGIITNRFCIIRYIEQKDGPKGC